MRRLWAPGLAAALASAGSLLLVACEDPPPPPPPLPALTKVAPAAGEQPPDPSTTVLTLPPSSGQQCRDDSDCPPNGALVGHCLCTMPIPDGPIETVGLCWNGRIKPKAWWCTVQDGHAFLHGLFVQE